MEQSHDLKAIFPYPGQDRDQLFHPTYDHVELEDTCAKCDNHKLVPRKQRISQGLKSTMG
jgi:hypothetical protein